LNEKVAKYLHEAKEKDLISRGLCDIEEVIMKNRNQSNAGIWEGLSASEEKVYRKIAWQVSDEEYAEIQKVGFNLPEENMLQTAYLKSIKNSMIFFVVLSVASIVITVTGLLISLR